MSSILVRPSTFREACLVLAFGVVGLLAQFACGGGSSPAAVPPPTPVITSFIAAKTPITTGTSTTLTAVFANGTGVVDKGVGAITSGTPVAVTLTADTTYTLTVSNSASVTTTSTVAVAVVAVPALPVITAPANLSTGLGGYTASTPTQAGMTLAWTITNGTLTSAANLASVTFTAGTTGSVALSCVATNAAGTASNVGTATVAIVGLPALPVITAPTKVTAGLGGYTASTPVQVGMTLTWTIANGTLTSAANLASVTFTAGTTGSVALSCVATNAANTPSTAGTATSSIVAAPTTPVISAPTYVSGGESGYRATVSAQADSAYTWTISGGSLVTGTGTASITFAAGASGSVVLGCRVTNAAETPSTAATASSTIVPFPTIELITASQTEIAAGAATVLSYAFSGGTGVIDHAVGTVTSGGTREVKPSATTTYTLLVTNLAGDAASDVVTITVPDLPVITTFKAASAAITVGQGTLLSFTFTGEGVIDPGVGTVTSGSQIAVLPTVATTYTLTATNQVGATTKKTFTVAVHSFTGKFVYVANSGGGVSGFSLNDTTGALVELGQSPWDEAKTALHVTSDPAGKFLFVVNGDGVVNLNTLTVYTINASSGSLTKVAAYSTGTDPWSSAVDPSGKFVYVRCDGSLSAFSLNTTTGVLAPLGTPSISTSGGSGEVVIHPSGLYLFTAGRTSDTLQVFNLNPATGALTANATQQLPAGTGPLALALSHTGEYLFSKSEGVSGGAAQACLVYGYHIDIASGGLTELAPMDTGLQNSDAYHGVSGNSTQPVIYITLVNSDNDYAAYALDLTSGSLTPIMGSSYDLFDATGSDSLVVSRNGKWGFLTNSQDDQVAMGAVDSSTGVILDPVFYGVGKFPVSIVVVGTVQ